MIGRLGTCVNDRGGGALQTEVRWVSTKSSFDDFKCFKTISEGKEGATVGNRFASRPEATISGQLAATLMD